MAQALYATDHRQGTLLASIGVTVVSFDSLLVRLAGVGSVDVIFWRGLFIALSMTVSLRVLRGRWPWETVRAFGWSAIVLAATMGLTQMLFVAAVMHTRVANVVVILASAPFFAAAFSGLFLREWVSPRTWLAMTLCIAGIAIVFGGSLGMGHWLGDSLALVLAIVVGANFTQLRRTPGMSRLAVVAGSGLLSALAVVPFVHPAATPTHSLGVLAVMGLLQMPIALVLMTEATRYLPSAEVSLFLVVESILGTFWVWLVLGEQPPGTTLLGGTVVICTLVGHSWLSLRRERARRSW